MDKRWLMEKKNTNAVVRRLSHVFQACYESATIRSRCRLIILWPHPPSTNLSKSKQENILIRAYRVRSHQLRRHGAFKPSPRLCAPLLPLFFLLASPTSAACLPVDFLSWWWRFVASTPLSIACYWVNLAIWTLAPCASACHASNRKDRLLWHRSWWHLVLFYHWHRASLQEEHRRYRSRLHILLRMIRSRCLTMCESTEFLAVKCGISAERAFSLRVELFRSYGSSLAGLIVLPWLPSYISKAYFLIMAGAC